MKQLLLQQIIVNKGTALRESLARMDNSGQQILLVVDAEKRLCGVVTDGDFRRLILQNKPLDIAIDEIMTVDFTALHQDDWGRAPEILKLGRINHVPIVDDHGRIVDLVSSVDLVKGSVEDKDYPVVIMAGGKGTRLSPLTKIIPKPLMPIGDKTMLEVIIEKFLAKGFKKFHVIVNYKKELIKSYFSESGLPYQVNFIDELDFLGTAGGLRLLIGMTESPFVLTNCDIIADVQYEKMLDWHFSHEAELTILGVRKQVNIPYGVINVDTGNYVSKIEEKPFFNFMIVSGIYIIEPSLLSLIPKDMSFGMDQLITSAIEHSRKVACYPVEDGWFDMGQFEEYKQLLKHFGELSA